MVWPRNSQLNFKRNQSKNPTKKWGFYFGELGKIRTCDLWLRKPTLYPAELRVHNNVSTNVAIYEYVLFVTRRCFRRYKNVANIGYCTTPTAR